MIWFIYESSKLYNMHGNITVITLKVSRNTNFSIFTLIKTYHSSTQIIDGERLFL